MQSCFMYFSIFVVTVTRLRGKIPYGRTIIRDFQWLLIIIYFYIFFSTMWSPQIEWLVRPTAKKTSNPALTGPLWGTPPVTGGGSTKSVNVSLSWRNDVLHFFQHHVLLPESSPEVLRHRVRSIFNALPVRSCRPRDLPGFWGPNVRANRHRSGRSDFTLISK